LRLGADLPVTSPFTMPVPDCTRLVGTTLLSSTTSEGTPFTRFTLSFGLSRGDQRTVSVTADSVATPASKPCSATLDIDGHAAGGDGDFRIVYDVDGFALELRIPGGEQAVEDLLRTVQMVPGAED